MYFIQSSNIAGDGPVYAPHQTPNYSSATPTPGQAPQLPGPGHDFTDQWVSQVNRRTSVTYLVSQLGIKELIREAFI